jgi:hypothetical protein
MAVVTGCGDVAWRGGEGCNEEQHAFCLIGLRGEGARHCLSPLPHFFAAYITGGLELEARLVT